MPTIRHIDIKGIEYFFSKSEGIRRDTKNSTRKTANVPVELTTHALLDPEKDLLGIDAATCGTLGFAELLDRVEEAVAIRLESPLAGDIPACPRDEDACTYCPVTVCSVRDALQRRSEGDE